MIRYLVLLTLLSFTGFSKTITLEDAKVFARKNNLEIKAQEAHLMFLERSLSASRGKYFPKLGMVLGGETQTQSLQRKTVALGYLYSTFNLFNGKKDSNEIESKKIDAKLAGIRKSLIEFNLDLKMEEFFYKLVFEKISEKEHLKSLKRNKYHQGIVNKQKKAGIATVSDIMDFSLNDSLLKSHIELIKQNKQELKLELIRLLGPDIGQGFEPFGELPHFHIEEDLKSILKIQTSKNKNLEMSMLGIEKNKIDLKTKKADWLPSVDLQIKAGYLPIEERSVDNRSTYSGLLTAKWEFFSGFETTRNIQAEQMRLRKNEYKLKDTLLEMMAKIESTFRKLKSIESRVDLEERNLAMSKRLYKSMLSEYRRGVKTSGDVKAAEESLRSASLRREELKLDYIIHKLQLEKILNRKLKLHYFKEGHKI